MYQTIYQNSTECTLLVCTDLSDNQRPARYQNEFSKQIDEQGIPVFHWVDTRVDKLSSLKLLDILHSSQFEDNRLDLEFIEEIRTELHRRNYPLEGDIL